jgi:peptide/nickel transport system substrate-binding protein
MKASFTKLSLCAIVLGWSGATVAQSPDTPLRGGSVAIPIHVGEPATYDCHATNSPAVMWRVSPHYSTLIKIDAERFPDVKGDLAKSWTVSNDGLVYTFKLHSGIKFHDGSTLTSQDVKVSFDRLRNPPPGVISLRQGMLSEVTGIETPDAQTVVFRFARPSASTLQLLGMPYACIYSAKMLASDPAYPGKRVMGTGPFKFVRHTPGAEWVGERFEGYFQQPKPYLDSFRMLNVSPVAATNALTAGQAQFSMQGFTPAEVSRISAARGESVKILGGKEATTFLPWFALNTQQPALKDERVRRALNLAIDRWGSSNAMEQLSPMYRVGGLIRPGSRFSRSEAELSKLPGFGRDINAAREEARRLLAAAGQSNLKLKLVNNRAFTYFGVFVTDQLRQIGVTVENLTLDTPQVAARRTSGDYDMIFDSPTEYVDDPTIQLGYFESFATNRINLARISDPQFEEIFQAQMSDLNLVSRTKRVREMEAYLMQKSYVIPLFWQSRKRAVDARVRGLENEPQSNYLNLDLADIWLEKGSQK